VRLFGSYKKMPEVVGWTDIRGPPSQFFADRSLVLKVSQDGSSWQRIRRRPSFVGAEDGVIFGD
jgi:hypothetical protein